MFLKCHHHLHPLGWSKSDFVVVNIDEDCSLDKFEMINTSELAKNLAKIKSIWFADINNGCEGYWMSFSMVGKTWIYFSWIGFLSTKS
jgi:hypothetical protein